MHAAMAVAVGDQRIRASEACAADIDDLGSERGHRTLAIVGKGNKPAVIPLVPRTPAPSTWPSANSPEDRSCCERTDSASTPGTAHRWTRTIGRRADLDRVHPHMLRAAFVMAALDAGVPLRDVQIAARHADPRTTTIYDRRRENLDRHAAYAVVAYVTSG
jgi:integrase